MNYNLKQIKKEEKKSGLMSKKDYITEVFHRDVEESGEILKKKK